MPEPTMRKREPCHRREDIFRFILAYKRENDGLAPSTLEIMQGCRVSSRSVVHYHLHALAKAGTLVLGPGRFRNIQVVGGMWIHRDGMGLLRRVKEVTA